MDQPTRRLFVSGFTLLGASIVTSACRSNNATPDNGEPSRGTAGSSPPAPAPSASGKSDDDKNAGEEVAAAEDLMREHGVIRRALVVYRESAARLRAKPSGVPMDALQRTAKLFRSFAEDYHEKKLEETHLFPAVKKAGGAAASLVDTLIAQHDRGREITDYLIAATAAPIGAKAEALARTLEGFARMYEEHTAFEDTVVFPAWKMTMTAKQLHEMGEMFETIEHKTFGKDGFDDAVEQIAAIEQAMGLELAAFLPPPPPRP